MDSRNVAGSVYHKASGTWQISLATSSDGLLWTKQGPVFKAADEKENPEAWIAKEFIDIMLFEREVEIKAMSCFMKELMQKVCMLLVLPLQTMG